MAFASGKKAFGISDRSGFRYRLRDMRKEWNGLLVGKDEFETKHPQLRSPRTGADPQALRDARPETGLAEQRAFQYGFNPVGFRDIPGITPDNALVATGGVGTVEIFFPETLGTQSQGQVGTVTVQTGLPVTTVISGFLSLSPSVGSVTVSTPSATVSVSATGSSSTASAGSVTATGNVTVYTVTVASGTNSYGSGNKYYIGGNVSPTLNLAEGSVFRFDQSDSSNSSHPLRFSTTANGTWNSGSPYTTGVTTNGTPGSSGAYTQITVASGAPTLYYYCTNHSGMGGQANTP
jgi:hypothetical protein